MTGPPAVLDRMVEAVNAGDARGYASAYAEDATIAIHGSERLDGRTAIEQHEIELLRQFPGARLAFRTIWQDGSQVAVRYAVNGRTPSGRTMGHEGLLFHRLDGSGRIASEHRYLDSLTPMAQLGALDRRPVRAAPTLPARTQYFASRGSTAERANSECTQESLSAWASSDRSAFLAGLAADAVVDEQMLPHAFAGKGQVSAWFDLWRASARDLELRTENAFAVDDSVLVELELCGTLVGSFGPVAADGQRFRVHRALIVQVLDGQISRLDAFMNGKELAQAVGRWPASLAE